MERRCLIKCQLLRGFEGTGLTLNMKKVAARNSEGGEVTLMPAAETVFEMVLQGLSLNSESERMLFGTLKGPYALACIEPVHNDKNPDRDICVDLNCNSPIPNVSIVFGNRIVAIAAYRSIRHLIEELVRRNDLSSFKAAYSQPFRSSESIPNQYELALATIESNTESGIFDAKKLAFPFLQQTIKQNVNLNGLFHPALDTIAEYDRENQTDLLTTLRVYLENDCNAQKCGRLLFLHRNSLVYRIRRIQEITGCDLSDVTERSYLRLSFYLKD